MNNKPRPAEPMEPVDRLARDITQTYLDSLKLTDEEIAHKITDLATLIDAYESLHSLLNEMGPRRCIDFIDTCTEIKKALPCFADALKEASDQDFGMSYLKAKGATEKQLKTTVALSFLSNLTLFKGRMPARALDMRKYGRFPRRS